MHACNGVQQELENWGVSNSSRSGLPVCVCVAASVYEATRVHLPVACLSVLGAKLRSICAVQHPPFRVGGSFVIQW
jgi:hypothetical protein